jgi:hypothetical protein
MDWRALKRYRIDVSLVGAAGIATTYTGIDALLAAHSLLHRATLGAATLAGVGAVLWSGWRALTRTAHEDEKDEQTQATLAYVLKPEAIRNMELKTASLVGEQEANALFCEHFDYSGPSTDTTARCRLCAYATNGTLAAVRADGVAHVCAAHTLAA